MIAGYVGTDPVEKIYLGDELIWPTEPPIDYTTQYFTHEYVSPNPNSSLNAGWVTVSMTYRLDDSNYVSFDDGSTWDGGLNMRLNFWNNPNRYVPNGLAETEQEAEQNHQAGIDKTIFKGTNPENNYIFFKGFGEDKMCMIQDGWNYKVYGNILSLFYGDNFSGQTEFANTSNSISYLFAFSVGPGYLDPGLGLRCLDASNLILTPRHLNAGCYEGLFYGQTSVSAVTCLATDISATDCTKNWLAGVSPTGVFYKHPNMTVGEPGGWTRGDSGIPTGWTVKDYPLPLPDVS